MNKVERKLYNEAIELYLFKGWKKREADAYTKIVFRDFSNAVKEQQYHTGASFAMTRTRAVKAIDLIVATRDMQTEAKLERAYTQCESILLTYRNNGGTVINKIFSHVEALAKSLGKTQYMTKWSTGPLDLNNPHWYSAHKSVNKHT